MLSDKYRSHIARTVRSVHGWHRKFAAKAPRGPELYFHLRCLDYLRSMEGGCVTKTHAECLYAMLTAWGMNSRRARLAPFRDVYTSLRKAASRIQKLRRVTLLEATQEDWNNQLKTIWERLTVTDSSSKHQLVGRSKMLAHLFPNWIAPVDYAHTISFLKPTGASSLNNEAQWRAFKEIHESFFAPTARKLHKYLECRFRRGDGLDWDTSTPKAIDNLIWGAREMKRT